MIQMLSIDDSSNYLPYVYKSIPDCITWLYTLRPVTGLIKNKHALTGLQSNKQGISLRFSILCEKMGVTKLLTPPETCFPTLEVI